MRADDELIKSLREVEKDTRQSISSATTTVRPSDLARAPSPSLSEPRSLIGPSLTTRTAVGVATSLKADKAPVKTPSVASITAFWASFQEELMHTQQLTGFGNGRIFDATFSGQRKQVNDERAT